MSKILFDEHPIVIPPSLARALGLKKSIIVQQIHYWLQHKLKDPNKYKNGFHQNKPWVYKTYTQWEDEMPYLGSLRSIKKEFKELQEMGVLIKGNFNKRSFDKTNWYTINYQNLEHLLSNIAAPSIVKHLHDGSAIPALSDSAISAPPIPKTTQRLLTKTTKEVCANEFTHVQAQPALPFDVSFENKEVDNAEALDQIQTDPVHPPVAKAPQKYSEEFESFWTHYPVKRDKSKAFKAWKRLKPNQELQTLLVSDVQQRANIDPQWIKGYVPYGERYLRDRRWEDEITASAESQTKAVVFSSGVSTVSEIDRQSAELKKKWGMA